MIPNGWHYLQVNKPSALLRGITSKHYVDLYFSNCFHFFRTKNKLESRKRICENKDFCSIIMPSEDTKILKFNQYQKSDKPIFLYEDLECVIGKIDGYKNNPENSSTIKVIDEPIPSSFSVSTISSFRSIKNKHDVA